MAINWPTYKKVGGDLSSGTVLIRIAWPRLAQLGLHLRYFAGGLLWGTKSCWLEILATHSRIYVGLRKRKAQLSFWGWYMLSESSKQTKTMLLKKMARLLGPGQACVCWCLHRTKTLQPHASAEGSQDSQGAPTQAPPSPPAPSPGPPPPKRCNRTPTGLWGRGGWTRSVRTLRTEPRSGLPRKSAAPRGPASRL